MAALPLEQVALSQSGRPGDPGRAAIGAAAVPPALPVALIAAAIGCLLSPPAANIAVAIALVLAVASRPTRQRLRAVVGQPLARGALIFLAVMTLAMLWASAPWHARLAEWWGWRSMLLIVLAAAAFGDARWKERFAGSLVVFVALAAVVSLGLWPTGRALTPDFAGTVLRNHVTQSMALAAAIVIGTMMALDARRSRMQRLWLSAAAVVCVADLVLVTGGRSGDVALLVAGVVAVLMSLRGSRRWQAVLLVLAVAAGLAAASPKLQQRFMLIAREAPVLDCSAVEESSTAIRLLVWRTTADLIAQRPWFGYGVGGFTPAFESRLPAELPDHTPRGWCARPVHDPHNQFLRVTAEAGVVGLLAFLGLLAGAARQRAAAPYRIYAVAMLAAWCVTSLFNSHFQTFNEGHLIALLLGAFLAPESPAPELSAIQPANASNTALQTSS